jgi:hypothetical protein
MPGRRKPAGENKVTEGTGKKAMPSEEVLVQAGRITSNFVMLEHSMQELVHALLGAPRHIAKEVTANQSFHAVQILATSLTKERMPNLSSELKRILRLVKRAEDKKDAVAFFIWGVEVEGGKRRREMLLGRLRLDEHGELMLGELLDIAAQISSLVRDVERLRALIGKDIQAGA